MLETARAASGRGNEMADTTGEAAVPAAVPPALETSAEITPDKPQAGQGAVLCL